MPYCNGMINAPIPGTQHLRFIADSHLPGTGMPRIARMQSGVSTPVYRIQRNGVTRYLRLAESAEANLAPEALAHERLRECAVSVPEVIHFEPFNQDLGRSLMITSAIPGYSLAEHHRGIAVDEVLRAAGRDLGRLQHVSVAGFGFVRRDLPIAAGLAGSAPTLKAFALDDLEAQLTALADVLSREELRQVQRAVEQNVWLLDGRHAVLVHGDFDATHIYHQDGLYTGIIDFGEIRGADPCYDLGHLALHDGEIVPFPLLPSVLTGYAEVAPLPSESDQRLQLWSLLIGVRALARSVNRPATSYQAYLRQAIQRALSAIVRT
jgi:aminoglycoside phosphotransferase (APT) family kinase protein